MRPNTPGLQPCASPDLSPERGNPSRTEPSYFGTAPSYFGGTEPGNLGDGKTSAPRNDSSGGDPTSCTPALGDPKRDNQPRGLGDPKRSNEPRNLGDPKCDDEPRGLDTSTPDVGDP